jgi:hypothetical protein
MNVYNKTEFPERKQGEDYSVDVLTCDEDGLLNLGFYNYIEKVWCFHTDTLQNYDEVAFVWMYAPKELEMKAGFPGRDR